MTCAAGIQLGQLVDLDGLDDDLEAHVFACADCGARLAWLDELRRALPAVLQAGQRMTLTRESVARLAAGGVRMRQYHFDDNRAIACTVGVDDDLVVSWLPLDAVDDDEVLACDMVGPGGVVVVSADDMPFDRGRRELILAEPAAALLRLPDVVLTLQLRAVGPRGVRPLGAYVYHHTAPR